MTNTTKTTNNLFTLKASARMTYPLHGPAILSKEDSRHVGGGKYVFLMCPLGADGPIWAERFEVPKEDLDAYSANPFRS